MIHASSWGITYDSLDEDYWANSYVGARRLVATDLTWTNSQNEELVTSAIDMLKN